MNDTQTALHYDHDLFWVELFVQELSLSLSGARSLVSLPGALVTSGYVSGRVFRPPNLNTVPNKTDETLVTLCLPN